MQTCLCPSGAPTLLPPPCAGPPAIHPLKTRTEETAQCPEPSSELPHANFSAMKAPSPLDHSSRLDAIYSLGFRTILGSVTAEIALERSTASALTEWAEARELPGLVSEWWCGRSSSRSLAQLDRQTEQGRACPAPC